MRSVVVALAIAVGTGCGPKHSTPPQPANIDVSCVLSADGANCTFTNAGAKAERCVVVLYGSKATGSVVASEKTCSGKLAKGATQSIAVRFPRRPADTCGADLAPCTTKVAEPDAAQDVALAWADELKEVAVPSGPPTAEECTAAAQHIVDVVVAQYDPTGENGTRAQMAEQQDYIAETCRTWTRSQLDCVTKADNSDAMGQCVQ